MVALTVLSMWAMSPLLSMAVLALTGISVFFTVHALVGFDVLNEDR